MVQNRLTTLWEYRCRGGPTRTVVIKDVRSSFSILWSLMLAMIALALLEDVANLNHRGKR
jgi:hypothetical protein